MVEEENVVESIVEKVLEAIHGHDSEDERKLPSPSSPPKRLFGRQKSVHKAFGGGKSADIFLWRKKKESAGMLAGATVPWLLFEWLEYSLVTLLCRCLIFSLVLLFLWFKASSVFNKSNPGIPDIQISEETILELASAIRIQINRPLSVLGDIASRKDLKEFLTVIAGLWVLSVVGGWCNFLTIFYSGIVLLFTVPVLYEKYEDQVDLYAEKATAEVRNQIAVLIKVVLSSIKSKTARGEFKQD